MSTVPLDPRRMKNRTTIAHPVADEDVVAVNIYTGVRYSYVSWYPTYYRVKTRPNNTTRGGGHKIALDALDVVRPDKVVYKLTGKDLDKLRTSVGMSGHKVISDDDLLAACDMFVKSHVPVASIPMYDDFLLDLVLFIKEQYE